MAQDAVLISESAHFDIQVGAESFEKSGPSAGYRVILKISMWELDGWQGGRMAWENWVKVPDLSVASRGTSRKPLRTRATDKLRWLNSNFRRCWDSQNLLISVPKCLTSLGAYLSTGVHVKKTPMCWASWFPSSHLSSCGSHKWGVPSTYLPSCLLQCPHTLESSGEPCVCVRSDYSTYLWGGRERCLRTWTWSWLSLIPGVCPNQWVKQSFSFWPNECLFLQSETASTGESERPTHQTTQ